MNTWTVNPSNTWLESNADWLVETQLPGIERCAMTLMSKRCVLVKGHRCAHAIFEEELDDATDDN